MEEEKGYRFGGFFCVYAEHTEVNGLLLAGQIAKKWLFTVQNRA